MSEIFYRRANPPVKDWGGRLPVALVFPEAMNHGLSTLGWQVVYRLLAAREEIAVERFFWDAASSKPQSVDSGRGLHQFPVVLFSINFEGDFPTVLRLLLDGDIPLRAAERSDWPLILAGGPVAFLNPFPLLPALDALFVGEAENGLTAVLLALHAAWMTGESKSVALKSIAALAGAFVPGQTQEPVRRALAPGQERVLENPAYSCFVSSEAQFRDMLLLEVNRGCPYGCRFCAAGSIYKPPRHATKERLQAIVEACQPEKVGLVGTALTDWPELQSFLEWLHARKTKFSLASLRADGLTEEFLTFLRRIGTRTITLAVEGSSQRLRRGMNKHFSEEIFLTAVERISCLQFNTLKLYMITGWPGEGEDDWEEFENFLERIDAARRAGQGNRKKGIELISISASCLVPKPWTALQWSPMPTEAWFKSSMKRFKKAVSKFKGMRFSGENPAQARMQAFFSRGGAEIFPCLEDAALRGAAKAVRDCQPMLTELVETPLAKEYIFPWDRLDVGVSKSFLYSEWKKYQHGLMTPVCPVESCTQCRRCGMDAFLEKA